MSSWVVIQEGARSKRVNKNQIGAALFLINRGTIFQHLAEQMSRPRQAGRLVIGFSCPWTGVCLSPRFLIIKALLDQFEFIRPADKGVFEAPETDFETVVAGVWEDVLKREQVGRRNNFFEMGGHSLPAVRLAAKLSSVMHLEVPVRYIFQYPTVAELCNALLHNSSHPENIEKTAALVIMIAGLSDEEAKNWLKKIDQENQIS